MGTKGPKVVTISGRLSFPTWTAKAAYDRSQKGSYPAADIASASPDFQLLLEPEMLDRLRKHIEDEFLPYCVEQNKKGDKKDNLSQKEADQLIAQINDPAFDGVLNMPFKPVHEKTAELAPECVVAVKCIGNKGVDIVLKGIVNDESELAIDDGTARSYPLILPLNETVHEMYAGAYVAATLNLYAYHNGKNAGFSAGASVAIFKADADRFGGGVTVDEDAVFAD